MKNKFLSVLLVICMVLTLMPMTALADFADTDGHWGKDAIDRWAAEGVLNGKGDDVFDPNGNMTRAEFAQMLCNLMGYTKKAPNTFTDVADDAWYADAILKLVEAGVLNGVGNNMAAPNAPITREQAAVMLCRAFDLKTSSASMSYSDAGAVSGWAAGAVAALTEKGMMNGVGNNQIAPQLNINRASVATLINNMVAEYVTEDKVITGEVNGIIVVAGDAKVTFEDATVNAPVIVAPSAEGAEVELTGTTTAENVVVAAEKAAVTVGKDASAESVTAAADKAEVKVEGKVDTVAVTGEDANVAVSGTAGNVAVSGEGAKVDVSGSVGTVSTEAANTTVAVSGTVSNVEVAEGADKTEITAASGAKIDSVTTSAEDVKVSGSGEVGSVTADAGSVDVTTKGTEVKNEGADNVTAGGKDVAAGESETVTTTPSSGGSSGGGSRPTPTAIDVIAANLTGFTDEDPAGGKATTYTATGSGTAITVTATGLEKTANSAGTSAYWVGVGLVQKEGATYAWGYGSIDDADLDDSYDEPTNTMTKGEKTYDTLYWGAPSATGADFWKTVKSGYISVKDGETVTNYTVTFNVATKADDNPTVTAKYCNDVSSAVTESELAAGNVLPYTIVATYNKLDTAGNYFLTITNSDGETVLGSAISGTGGGTSKKGAFSLLNAAQCELVSDGYTLNDLVGDCTLTLYKTTNEAGNTTVSVNGTSGSVTLSDGVPTKEDVKFTQVATSTVTVTAPVIAAKLADHPSGGTAVTALGETSVEIGEHYYKGGDNKTIYLDVTLKGEDIVKHHNTSQTEGYWVGIGVPADTNASYQTGWNAYSSWSGGGTKDNDQTEDEVTYRTFYFAKTWGESDTGYVAVKDKEVTIVYVITFDVSVAADEAAD